MDLQQKFEIAFQAIPLGDTGKSILEAGFVHGCLVNDDFAKITLIIPENSPFRKTLPTLVETEVNKIDEINRVAVEVLAEAPEEKTEQSQPQRPARQAKKTSYLQNYDNVIVVASGKGGVGKSTVSLNLAIALTKMDFQVSFFDADIYGPSFPIMAGLRGVKPVVENNQLLPLEAHGISAISIGNLVDEDSSTVWRGPMVHQAIEQLLRDTQWPGGNFMIMDLPPGTGDAQLTLSQVCEIDGAVIVSTPQEVALLDARKAMNMFTKVDIDIAGIVENMSYYVDANGNEVPIFGEGGAKKLSQELTVPFLGKIPIDMAIREGGDTGFPLMVQEQSTVATTSFETIAQNLIHSLDEL